MSETIIIDPLTRIEGHLRIEIKVEKNKVVEAYSSGEMFRGIEIILRDRSPLDAPMISQRICGVCPQVHGTGSVMALDDAFGIKPAKNGRIIRNLMLGSNFLNSHILHFYLLSALDFVDITAVLDYKGMDSRLIKIKEWIKSDIDSGATNAGSPFLPRYDGDYIKDHELNMHALSSYLKAIEIKRKCHEMLAIFGGKVPHCQTLVPGGVTCIPTVDKIMAFRSRLSEIKNFVEKTYIPDVLTIAKNYPDYFIIGKGATNFMSYGGFPEDEDNSGWLFPQGVLIDGNVSDFDSEKVEEFVKHSKYSSGSGLNPFDGQTTPSPFKDDAYSWIKSPRYSRNVVEVGPLARAMVSYHANSNNSLNILLKSALNELGATPESLVSTMGRHAARALESKVLIDRMESWLDELVPEGPVANDFKIPFVSKGKGLIEGPRGSLGHWIKIENKRISNYQAVVPTTWNGSPKDDDNKPGPFEMALIGTPVADYKNPIEPARVIRSFDPCLACAIHVMDLENDSVYKFKI
ncbi:MAG: nickel-dependent hydrogenase large subunit [Actinomycetota bacterium]|nr:nickel-dependent hydrogenase large subunit [Actinomycetota bacterium]